jgi:O-6-methylguanine DNA methyltransferase
MRPAARRRPLVYEGQDFSTEEFETSSRTANEPQLFPNLIPATFPECAVPEVHPQPRVFHTVLGWLGFLGSDRGMTVLTFGHDQEDDVYDRLNFESVWNRPARSYDDDTEIKREIPPQPAWMDEAESLLIAYCEGDPVDLSAIPCDLPPGTRFEQRVREELSRIGYGRTITYGELAAAAGAPRAARAVGSVMARNQIPLVIPCHRVVASGGKLGGYSAPSGLSMKECLLAMEQRSVISSRS